MRRSGTVEFLRRLSVNSVADFASFFVRPNLKREGLTGDLLRGPSHYTMAGRFLPKSVACSNACAICRTLKSSRVRPTICTPTGSPSGVNPPGTAAAGFPVADTYQQDFIQSMYELNFTPAISVGYGVSTSNGGNCVVGRTKYSNFSRNA